MKKIVSGIEIECVQGNIAAQEDMDVIVNAANAQLRKGGGVAGAIHAAAGPGLEEECRPLAPIKPGEAVITGGQNLPNRYVIHCLGPIYGVDSPAEKLLANCYRQALNIAEKYQLNSIAFPAISTGIFGYPIEEAAEVCLCTVRNLLPSLKHVTKIRFVLYRQKDLEVYEQKMELLL